MVLTEEPVNDHTPTYVNMFLRSDQDVVRLGLQVKAHAFGDLRNLTPEVEKKSDIISMNLKIF